MCVNFFRLVSSLPGERVEFVVAKQTTRRAMIKQREVLMYFLIKNLSMLMPFNCYSLHFFVHLKFTCLWTWTDDQLHFSIAMSAALTILFSRNMLRISLISICNSKIEFQLIFCSPRKCWIKFLDHTDTYSYVRCSIFIIFFISGKKIFLPVHQLKNQKKIIHVSLLHTTLRTS